MSKTSKCPRCQELAAEVAKLREEAARLRDELAKSKKNSTTSSKPPSSDIVKPKSDASPADGEKRSIGGQPGHPKHERAPFPLEQVQHFACHELQACPDCGGVLRRNGWFEHVVQQVDIGAAPLWIEQHICPEYWCDHCHKACSASSPRGDL